MKNWKAIIGVIAIFILGGLAGSITTIGLVRHRLVHGHGSQMWQDVIIRRLSWDLRLDRAQRAQLRVIVAQGHEDMKVIRQYVDDADFLEALDKAPPGIIDRRSWAYWNSKMGRYPAPPEPVRKLE